MRRAAEINDQSDNAGFHGEHQPKMRAWGRCTQRGQSVELGKPGALLWSVLPPETKGLFGFLTSDGTGKFAVAVVAWNFLVWHGPMASTVREPIMRVWGRSPQRGPGAEPLVRESGGLPP